MVKQDVGSVGFHPQLGLNGGIQWMDGWMDGWMMCWMVCWWVLVHSDWYGEMQSLFGQLIWSHVLGNSYYFNSCRVRKVDWIVWGIGMML